VRLVLSWLPLDHGTNARNFAWLVLLSFAISLVASANGVGAIYTAFAGDLVTATGPPLPSVLMILVLGFSPVAFAYQAPPIMVALGLGNATPADAARIGVPLAMLTFLVLLPLGFVWWRPLWMI
jgi:di/tricarboxylate transporter